MPKLQILRRRIKITNIIVKYSTEKNKIQYSLSCICVTQWSPRQLYRKDGNEWNVKTAGKIPFQKTTAGYPRDLYKERTRTNTHL